MVCKKIIKMLKIVVDKLFCSFCKDIMFNKVVY